MPGTVLTALDESSKAYLILAITLRETYFTILIVQDVITKTSNLPKIIWLIRIESRFQAR